MARTVTLSKPLKTHDGESSKLTLRDLNAGDIVEMREAPFKITQLKDGTIAVEVNYAKTMEYLSLLSGVDDLILKSLGATDFQNACTVVSEIWNGLGE